jgi:drug/metabolite transporter (DMT)-like permease
VAAFFFGIQELPLPDAVTLQFTTPPFAAAFAVCMVGEPWRILDMIGAIVCLSGVALIAHPSWLFGGGGGGSNDANEEDDDDDDDSSSALMKTIAVCITTGGAAAAGVAYVMVRVIGNRADAIVMVLYYAVMSLPLCYFGSGYIANDWQVWQLHGSDSDGDGDDAFQSKDYILLLLMGLGGYGGQWFTNLGLQNETAGTYGFRMYSTTTRSCSVSLSLTHTHMLHALQPRRR